LFARAFSALGPKASQARMFWIPGRIEFLGKHTDYAGGPSLVCAVERGFAVATLPRVDRRVHIYDACRGVTAEAELTPELVVRQDHWSNYPLTVCRRIARNFSGALHGVDLAFASDLPPAAGLSSSSALIVATFLALGEVNDLPARAEYRSAIRDTEDLAGYLGAVENGSDFRGLTGDSGVGTQGGSEDHTAILCARARALVQYAYVPIRLERAVPLPNDHVFVIAASGVAAAKAGSARDQYNRASATAAAALDIWRVATGSAAPTLAAALAESPDGIEQFRLVLEQRPELMARVEHFAVEAEIIRAAGDALAQGDLKLLGGLVDRSQATAERLLGNQVKETIALARSAREVGAVAASAFGAGYGGSVYALVEAADADRFRRRWAAAYMQAFPSRGADASFFVTPAGPPASRV